VTGPGAQPAPAGIARRVVAEFTGTALLVAAAVGSGIAAARLSPHDTLVHQLHQFRQPGGHGRADVQ
jgi:hypothetical protein